MKNIELKSRKWLRRIFGCISFTAVAFIFQACYGTGSDYYSDVKLKGTVKSKTTNLPIKGIKVTMENRDDNYGITDKNGEFSFYTSYHNDRDDVKVFFYDIDSIENGSFADTAILIQPNRFDEVVVNVVMREK